MQNSLMAKHFLLRKAWVPICSFKHLHFSLMLSIF